MICDPACGTAGFLVAASEHLMEDNSDTIYKGPAARRHFDEGTFHGYDFDNIMLRIGSMNMLLHGPENPDIRYRDSLAQTDEDDAEKYSLIFANPPFCGKPGLRVHRQGPAAGSQGQEDRVASSALFLRRSSTAVAPRHRPRRRTLRVEQGAHRTLRTILVEGQKLGANVSMPSGVSK